MESQSPEGRKPIIFFLPYNDVFGHCLLTFSSKESCEVTHWNESVESFVIDNWESSVIFNTLTRLGLIEQLHNHFSE